MRRLLRLRVETWFGVAFGLLVLVGSLQYRITRRLLDSNHWAEHTDAVVALVEDVRSYIQKPVDFEQFRETIRQVGFYWLVVKGPP